MRFLTRVLLCVFLAVPALAGSFDDLRGPGTDESITLIDEEISAKIGTDIAYHLAYTKWTPDEPNETIIVYNHGLQSHRGWFNRTANDLVARGYTIYAFDRIGSGTSSPGLSVIRGELRESRGHVRDWHLLTKSLDAMVDFARKQNPDGRIVVWGNSYGAKVVTAWLMEHADDARSRGVESAVFTAPGLFANDESMPLPFSKMKLIFSRNMCLYPLPMVEKNDDNGAHWFIGEGEWFDRIRDDDLSIREVTRRFYLETNAMDSYIRKWRKGSRLPVPTFHLMVRNDPMMDNVKTEAFVKARASDGLYKFFKGGEEAKHFLLFTSDRDEALRDIDSFLSGRRGDIEQATAISEGK
jgi:alpha-beta hydrolase superfamily lysophospholipase